MKDCAINKWIVQLYLESDTAHSFNICVLQPNENIRTPS